MKNILLTLIMGVLFGAALSAQNTPKAPTPPKPTKKSTSYSIHISDDDKDSLDNTSVTISQSDDAYKFKASFNERKNEKVKAFLLKRLGKKYLIASGDRHTWTRKLNGEESFECKLSDGKLRIYMDKDSESDDFYIKIIDIGEELNELISGGHGNGRNNAEHAQRELEQAQRDMEQARRDMEQAKHDMERARRDLELAREELIRKKRN